MARLPQPGSDEGQWGNILNEYLRVAHADDGSLKPQATHPLPDATASTKGGIRLAGDLAGDALVPLIAPGRVTGGTGGAIAAGAITNVNIHNFAAIEKSKLATLEIIDADVSISAGIAQSKIHNLESDLAAKSALNHVHTISQVTSLQSELDAKAPEVHTHDASSINGLSAAVKGIIGESIQAGENVTVNYNAQTGLTTIASTGAASGISAVLGMSEPVPMSTPPGLILRIGS